MVIDVAVYFSGVNEEIEHLPERQFKVHLLELRHPAEVPHDLGFRARRRPAASGITLSATEGGGWTAMPEQVRVCRFQTHCIAFDPSHTHTQKHVTSFLIERYLILIEQWHRID